MRRSFAVRTLTAQPGLCPNALRSYSRAYISSQHQDKPILSILRDRNHQASLVRRQVVSCNENTQGVCASRLQRGSFSKHDNQTRCIRKSQEIKEWIGERKVPVGPLATRLSGVSLTDYKSVCALPPFQMHRKVHQVSFDSSSCRQGYFAANTGTSEREFLAPWLRISALNRLEFLHQTDGDIGCFD